MEGLVIEMEQLTIVPVQMNILGYIVKVCITACRISSVGILGNHCAQKVVMSSKVEPKYMGNFELCQ